MSGNTSEYVRVGDEGSHARFLFCPICGCTVYYSVDEMLGLMFIPVGVFGDPAFPQPTVSVYEERMHLWVGLPGGMEHCA